MLLSLLIMQLHQNSTQDHVTTANQTVH